jgi:hypothetical protein
MTRLSALSRSGVVVCGAILAIVPTLQARSCSGNGDVVGSFGWLGVRTSDFVPAATTPPRAVASGSSTPVGSLLAGAVNTAAFTSVGRVFLDGNGAILATSTPGGAQTSVGTYTVNGDCTVSATLTDAFLTAASTGLAPTQASATFEGVVVEVGNEIDLVQTGTVTGTAITLRKTKQSCTIDGVFDAFGLSATGVTTTTAVAGTPASSTPTSTPFSIVGRFVADGAGNLVEDAIAQASPLNDRKVTGTYMVNMDCTGTATLITADGKKRAANFVIVTLGADLSHGPQALELAFTDSGVVGSGLAQQQ